MGIICCCVTPRAAALRDIILMICIDDEAEIIMFTLPVICVCCLGESNPFVV
jgi:hypothetical protein